MAMSNSERQRKFREEHKDDTCRLDLRISAKAWYALNRLSKSEGVTKRKFLEELLIRLDDEKISKMTPEEFGEYLNKGMRSKSVVTR